MYDLYTKNLDTLLHGSEAIQFQNGSKLGSRLVDLFTQCYKIREEYYDQEKNNYSDVNKRIASLIEKEMRTIIKEEANFNVKEFEFSYGAPSGYVAIDYMTYYDVGAVMNVENMLTGSYFPKENDSKTMALRIEKLVDVAKHLDVYSGKLKYKKGFNIALSIDLSLFFFLDLFTDTRLSPEEGTAIILHEIGHVTIFLERATVAMFVYQAVDDNVKKSPNKDVDVATVKKMLNLCITKTGTSNKFLDGISDLALKTLNFINDMQDKLDGAPSKAFGSVNDGGWIHLGPIIQLLARIARMLIAHYNYELLGGWLLSFQVEITGALAIKKTSDIKYTAHNEYLLERAADEFVVRHGFGAALASSLYKVQSYTIMGSTQAIHNSFVVAFLAKVFFKLREKLHSSLPYEAYNQRCRRIIQAVIPIFKDANLPADIRNKAIDQLLGAMKILDKYGQSVYDVDDMRNRLLNTLITVISVEDWMRILTSGRLTQEYERHLNMLEDLTNNFMYADAAILKKLVDDMKK